ncbi:hypothetical protein FB45DRAFT_1007662 [Roridomyces roridus]|uniref:F-box domain-containing protein n=1 Tax=Roridomyces roridus TaxID=1738132 RepID=A0AAD7BDJ0_9AGAR|nr:hypothetical protein FB45DRAFT_1007662 [Roridomyces roridus]
MLLGSRLETSTEMGIPSSPGWIAYTAKRIARYGRKNDGRQLTHLNEDVLGEILSYCDIYHILLFSRVNRVCRRIALSKHLWISLLRDLEFRALLDLGPKEQLEAYETPELIDMVKRVSLGPRTWSPTSSTPPTIRREVVLHFDVPHGPGTGIHLLPGGKYVVFWKSRGVFALWGIASQRCIWTHPALWWFWSIDVPDGGHVAVVGLGSEVFGQQAGDLEVNEVDLRTGDSRVRFRARIPCRFGTAGQMNILGDIFTVALSTKTSREILIVNWRANTCVRLKFPLTSLICSSLVQGHLIVAYRDSYIHNGVVSGVYPLASFHWNAMDPNHPWSHFGETTRRPPTTITLPFASVHRMTFLEMQTYRSPTRRDTYKVTIKLRIRLPPRRLAMRLWDKVTISSSDDDSTCLSFLQAYILSPSTVSDLRILPTIPQPRNRMFPHTVSGYATDLANRELSVVDGWGIRDGIGTVDGKLKNKESREVLRRSQLVSSAWPMLGEYSAAVPLLEERTLRILYFD